MEKGQRKKRNRLARAIWRHDCKSEGIMMLTIPMLFISFAVILTMEQQTAAHPIIQAHFNLIAAAIVILAILAGLAYNYRLSVKEANLLLKIKAGQYTTKKVPASLVITGEITIAGKKTEAQISIPREAADAFHNL